MHIKIIGKTGISITPYGNLVMCTDTCPVAITDNDSTEHCGVLDMIKDKGATVLTDKGFGIEDLSYQRLFPIIALQCNLMCNTRKVIQCFSKNFDVATLRIYNENYIGGMRDWSILNACCHKN